ncbi:hypothetical protein [Nonlabens agnitus]|nr:hypothetical protein [Nonlabens agnitus]
MKNNFFYFVIFILLASCGPSDDSMDPEVVPEDFNIQLSATNTAVVDEVVPVMINSSKPMASLTISFDNFQTSTTAFSDQGSSQTRFFKFDKLGMNSTVYFRAKDEDGNEFDTTYTPNISRGNSVKINQIKINSFAGIDTTLDPEFPETDPNRLADVFFVLLKPGVDIRNGDVNGANEWYRSPVKQNQGDLTWDLTNAELYINPEFRILYTMADDDGNFVQDLMQAPPFEREFRLSDFADTRPSEVTLSVPSIDLEVVFTVDWN